MSTEPITAEHLAEIIWHARKKALGDGDDGQTFAAMSARIRRQYTNEATEVLRRVDLTQQAEVHRLRAELAQLQDSKKRAAMGVDDDSYERGQAGPKRGERR